MLQLQNRCLSQTRGVVWKGSESLSALATAALAGLNPSDRGRCTRRATPVFICSGTGKLGAGPSPSSKWDSAEVHQTCPHSRTLHVRQQHIGSNLLSMSEHTQGKRETEHCRSHSWTGETQLVLRNLCRIDRPRQRNERRARHTIARLGSPHHRLHPAGFQNVLQLLQSSLDRGTSGSLSERVAAGNKPSSRWRAKTCALFHRSSPNRVSSGHACFFCLLLSAPQPSAPISQMI